MTIPLQGVSGEQGEKRETGYVPALSLPDSTLTFIKKKERKEKKRPLLNPACVKPLSVSQCHYINIKVKNKCIS